MKRPNFDRKIKTTGLIRDGDRIGYIIDPSEQQVLDNRKGPRLNPPPQTHEAGWRTDEVAT